MEIESVDKIRNVDVVFEAPPAKAHTLRVMILASLAEGQSIIRRPLLAEDQLNVLECLRRLGIDIERDRGDLRVFGRGGRYAPTGEDLDVGESGVGMNFLTSAACLADIPVVLTGTERLLQRPIGELVAALRQLGCEIEYLGEEGFPPIRVRGGGIKGGTARMHGAVTSQYFSSLVIAAACADSPVIIECLDAMSERPYFDITLQMMAEFGIEAENDGYKKMRIPNDRKYRARDLSIEGDYSSASFFFLAAAVAKSKITVTGLNPDTRQGDKYFLNLIEKMGCRVSVGEEKIVVEGGDLAAIEEDMSNVPDLVPPAAIAAAFAEGASRFTNIAQLRVKESDRLKVMVSELAKMGVTASCDADSLTVNGAKDIHGARIDPHNDHRIAMSFAAAGLAVGGQTVENPGCVAKSFPDFWKRFEIFRKE